jgi:putative aminopeptidase FrvX
MTDRAEMNKVHSWEEARVDVGTRSRKETERLGIRILDPMVFKKDITYITPDLMCSRGIDNRAGCAIPDYVFAVDTMTTTDAPIGGDTYEKVFLGKGPAMRMFDNAAIASPKLRKLLEEVAKANKIPLQYGTGGGSTDGAAMQDFGSLMMPIGIPMRYTHSPTECASMADIENTVKLVVKTAERIAKSR